MMYLDAIPGSAGQLVRASKGNEKVRRPSHISIHSERNLHVSKSEGSLNNPPNTVISHSKISVIEN